MAYQIFFCDDDAEASAIYLPKIKAAFKARLEHVDITAFRSPGSNVCWDCSCIY